jgi:hypothetical protein
MIDFIKRLFSRYGFHRSPEAEAREYFSHIPAPTDAQLVKWGEDARCIANDPAYLASVARQQLNMAPGAVKARRLAEIARQRNALKDELAKVIKAKKARAPVYAALRALSIEELKVEGRR